eukprot:scaffold27037_cov57-Phaeocystis_antarctica.AAC.3
MPLISLRGNHWTRGYLSGPVRRVEASYDEHDCECASLSARRHLAGTSQSPKVERQLARPSSRSSELHGPLSLFYELGLTMSVASVARHSGAAGRRETRAHTLDGEPKEVGNE